MLRIIWTCRSSSTTDRNNDNKLIFQLVGKPARFFGERINKNRKMIGDIVNDSLDSINVNNENKSEGDKFINANEGDKSINANEGDKSINSSEGNRSTRNITNTNISKSCFDHIFCYNIRPVLLEKEQRFFRLKCLKDDKFIKTQSEIIKNKRVGKVDKQKNRSVKLSSSSSSDLMDEDDPLTIEEINSQILANTSVHLTALTADGKRRYRVEGNGGCAPQKKRTTTYRTGDRLTYRDSDRLTYRDSDRLTYRPRSNGKGKNNYKSKSDSKDNYKSVGNNNGVSERELTILRDLDKSLIMGKKRSKGEANNKNNEVGNKSSKINSKKRLKTSSDEKI